MSTPMARPLVANVALAGTIRIGDAGLRAPFGWQVAGLPPAATATAMATASIGLSWPTGAAIAGTAPWGPARLRIAVLDTREERNLVRAALAVSGRVLGHFDIRWAAHFQVFELELDAASATAALQEGVTLTAQEGEKPLWILTGNDGPESLPPTLAPHLLATDGLDAVAEFGYRMESLACVQSFGWMEGCVLDGLADLGALPGARPQIRANLRRHLALFFKDHGDLVYEGYHCQPLDNQLATIESTLPYAALCREFPEHPALELALQFWRGRVDAEGCVQDGGHTSTEGSYTVGYPMAVLARSRQDEALAKTALLQVRLRHQRLFDGRRLARWRTVAPDGTTYGNINWARGIAWQLLGTARTLLALEGMKDLSADVQDWSELAAWAATYQLENGLWSVFVDEPALVPDTSGSAGIAAAFAMGANAGWLDAQYLAAARKTASKLERNLTPDGLLLGASQPNKGGEALQRSSYRAIYQMGMGLLAQLQAQLGS